MKLVILKRKFHPERDPDCYAERLLDELIDFGENLIVVAERFSGDDESPTCRWVPVPHRHACCHNASFDRSARKVLETLRPEEPYQAVLALNCTQEAVDLLHVPFPLAVNACTEKNFNCLRHWFDRRFEKKCLNGDSAAKIVVDSYFQKQQIARYYQYPSERIVVIPPGILHEAYYPASIDEKNQSRKNLHFHRPFIMIFGAPHWKLNGLDCAIRAFAQLPPDIREQWLFVVMGEGERGAFVNLASKLGVADDMMWAGAADEWRDWLITADLLIYPARCGADDQHARQAMSCGVPVLVSRDCGIAELVPDENTGYVVDSAEDIEQMSEKIRLFTSLPEAHRQRMGENCVAQVAGFSWRNYAEKLLLELPAQTNVIG